MKKLVPSTERGEKRLNWAKELKALSDFTLGKLGVKFEKEENVVAKEEKEVDEPIEEIEVAL